MRSFLNTLYFVFLKSSIDLQICTIKIMNKILVSVFNVFPQRLKRKLIERQERLKKETIDDLHDYKNGMIKSLFEQIFIISYGFFVSPSFFISFPIVFLCTNSFPISMFIGLSCFGLSFIPLFKYVLYKNQYLKYIKEYKNNDSTWFKKWRMIVILFVVLSYVNLTGGVILTIRILKLGGVFP